MYMYMSIWKYTYTFSYMYALLTHNPTIVLLSESQRARSNWTIRNRLKLNRGESSQTLDDLQCT